MSNQTLMVRVSTPRASEPPTPMGIILSLLIEMQYKNRRYHSHRRHPREGGDDKQSKFDRIYAILTLLENFPLDNSFPIRYSNDYYYFM